jgi:hypothetical protein
MLRLARATVVVPNFMVFQHVRSGSTVIMHAVEPKRVVEGLVQVFRENLGMLANLRRPPAARAMGAMPA